MALFPEVQEKVVDELQRVFLTSDEEVDEEHLIQLTYLDWVIREALRFWTVIPHVERMLTEDMLLGNYSCLRHSKNA